MPKTIIKVTCLTCSDEQDLALPFAKLEWHKPKDKLPSHMEIVLARIENGYAVVMYIDKEEANDLLKSHGKPINPDKTKSCYWASLEITGNALKFVDYWASIQGPQHDS